ncbi:MAG: hypothetical protein Q9160_003110 [Pyrenula sp. 1 TL-2023]
MTKVSRKFNDIATRDVYRKVIVNDTKSMLLLYQTLHQNAYLASLVYHFILVGPKLSDLSAVEIFPQDTSSQRENKAQHQPNLPRFDYELDKNASALVPLILSRLPNLRSVEFGINHLYERGPCALAFGVPTSEQHSMKPARPIDLKLKAVIIARDLDQEGRKLRQEAWTREYLGRSPDSVFASRPVNPELVAHLCALKGLHTLDMLLPVSMRFWKPTSWLNTASNPTLKTLVLRSTLCGEDTLGKILQITPQLKSLTYERFYDSEEDPHRLPHPKRLAEALIQVKDSLEELHVRLEVCRHGVIDGNISADGDHYPGPHESVGSLLELRNLHTLEIPLEILFGDGEELYTPLHAIIPPSLRSLTLRNDLLLFTGYYPWTPADLVERLSADFGDPSMYADRLGIEEIHLGLVSDAYWWNAKERQHTIDQLDPLCRACGVRLTAR